MWIDITCETDAGEIRIKGATDPVIVDAESEPLLLTESKTKRSLDHLDEPDRHHLAQTHCYMYGLTQKHDRCVTDARLPYGSRTSLDLRAFHVAFDPWFWGQTVLSWADDHTQLRLDEELPAANPEFSWECNVCSYRHRCGQASETSFGDVGATGLLPGFDDYPREKVHEYLDCHDGARLTPTLARRYPRLANFYDISNWWCQNCTKSHSYSQVEWNESLTESPLCPSCSDEGVPVPLTELLPEEHEDFAGE